MNFVTYNHLQNDVKEWAKTLPRDFDAIIGVERSGMLPASILAMHMHKPLLSLDTFIHYLNTGQLNSYINSKMSFSRLNKVLIVDDSISSGATIRDIKSVVIKKPGIYTDVKFGCVYGLPGNHHLVDYVFKDLLHPRMFEWNFMHHEKLSEAILDIDGVLCEEPPVEDNERAYTDYIGSAKPLYIPSVPVLGLVTGRLEKYRALTEVWLQKMGIKYGFLMMAAYDTPQERRKNDMGKYKADVYNSIPGATLFIESSHDQALTIKSNTNKEVICIENIGT